MERALTEKFILIIIKMVIQHTGVRTPPYQRLAIKYPYEYS